LLHNAAFRAQSLGYVYLAFPVSPDHLNHAITAIRVLGLAGVNLTVPHKQRAVSLLDRVSPEVALIGAVNTVHNDRGSLVGYNTDSRGFLESLIHDGGFTPRGTRAVLLGAGGAAAAVAHALLQSEVAHLVVANRTVSRAQELAVRLTESRTVPEGIIRPVSLVSEQLREYLRTADLIVNATTLGLHSDDPSPCPTQWLGASALYYDLVYHRRTAFLQEAHRRGLRAVDGLGMLVRQAAASWEIWTGRTAPLELMFEVTRRQLAGGGR
jgi:shikimate dehydrogenase